MEHSVDGIYFHQKIQSKGVHPSDPPFYHRDKVRYTHAIHTPHE